MEWMVVATSLLARKRENKALEPGVADPSSDEIRERVVPGPSTIKVPSSFEGVGIDLRSKQGRILALYTYLCRVFSLTCQLCVESSNVSDIGVENGPRIDEAHASG